MWYINNVEKDLVSNWDLFAGSGSYNSGGLFLTIGYHSFSTRDSSSHYFSEYTISCKHIKHYLCLKAPATKRGSSTLFRIWNNIYHFHFIIVVGWKRLHTPRTITTGNIAASIIASEEENTTRIHHLSVFYKSLSKHAPLDLVLSWLALYCTL